MSMRHLKVTAGGQVSLPADIRRRWGTRTVSLEDRGDEVVLRPALDDPVGALRGLLRDYDLPSSEELRREAREDELAAEERHAR
jgi:AbrB family looped-hinge helix DNA binding protein